jgi:thioredoxin-related protein
MGQLVEELKPKYDSKINFRIVFVDEQKEQPVAKKYNVQFVPMTMLFDKNGNETESLSGVVDKAILTSKLDALAK